APESSSVGSRLIRYEVASWAKRRRVTVGSLVVAGAVAPAPGSTVTRGEPGPTVSTTMELAAQVALTLPAASRSWTETVRVTLSPGASTQSTVTWSSPSGSRNGCQAPPEQPAPLLTLSSVTAVARSVPPTVRLTVVAAVVATP